MNRLYFDFVYGSRSRAFRSDPETRHDDSSIKTTFGRGYTLPLRWERSADRLPGDSPRIHLRAARDVTRYIPIYLVIDVTYFTALGRGGALV